MKNETLKKDIYRWVILVEEIRSDST